MCSEFGVPFPMVPIYVGCVLTVSEMDLFCTVLSGFSSVFISSSGLDAAF